MEKVYFSKMIGTRQEKYQTLGQLTISAVRTEIQLTSPMFSFSRSADDADIEFNNWLSLEKIMTLNSGSIITSRDNLAIDFDKNTLLMKIDRFAKSSPGDKSIENEIGFSIKGKWDVEGCKSQIRRIKPEDRKNYVKPVLYRPFDWRWIFYLPSLLDTPSKPVCSSIYDHENMVLLTPRINTTSNFCHVLVANVPSEKKACSHDRATQMFPLFEYQDGLFQTQTENISIPYPKFHKNDRENAQDFFYYIYAILHSLRYRNRYGSALQNDYPHIPITKDNRLFEKLSQLGKELVALHLLESPTLKQPITDFVGKSDSFVEAGYPKYEKKTVWINDGQGFEGVPQAVWDFQIGGYQVCHKWLKDRRGRKLSAEDKTHYAKIVVALKETIRLMKEIDATIPAWPIE